MYCAHFQPTVAYWSGWSGDGWIRPVALLFVLQL